MFEASILFIIFFIMFGFSTLLTMSAFLNLDGKLMNHWAAAVLGFFSASAAILFAVLSWQLLMQVFQAF